MAETNILMATIRLEFTVAETKILNFIPIGSPDPYQVNYLGVAINQEFNDIAIHNTSDIYDCYFSIESALPVGPLSSGGDGIKLVPPGSAYYADPAGSIRRLQVYMEGAGIIECVLYKKDG